MDNIYSAYHYACKTKADREVVEELAPKVIEAAASASFGNIGDIKYTVRTDVPNGGEWCDGAEYTQSKYPDLYKMLTEGKLQYVDIATYNNVVELNGSCGLFGLDVANKSFRVPLLDEVYIKSGQVADEFSAESLPNLQGNYTKTIQNGSFTADGVFADTYGTKDLYYTSSTSGGEECGYINFNASNYSSTYQDGAKVNPDHVTYRAYVILYSGIDLKADITKEYQLNNPFSLLDYKWSEYELNNASWLLSNGAFHSGEVYKSAYELLMKIYNGAETKDGVSVKLSTEEYSDTDFVVDTANTTFRLPVKVANAPNGGIAPVIGTGQVLGLSTGSKMGGLSISSNSGNWTRVGATAGSNIGSAEGTTLTSNVGIGVTLDPTKSGIIADLSLATNDKLKLYFYVGETVQDANVINASGVLTRVAELSDSYISGLGMPSDRYIDLTLGASGTTYTAPANGWFYISKIINASDQYLAIENESKKTGCNSWPNGTSSTARVLLPVQKGDIVKVVYTAKGSTNYFRFIYAEGDK